MAFSKGKQHLVSCFLRCDVNALFLTSTAWRICNYVHFCTVDLCKQPHYVAQVGDGMHEAHTVPMVAKLSEISALIVRKHLHRVFVVDGDSKLVGVISRGDIMKATVDNFNTYVQSSTAWMISTNTWEDSILKSWILIIKSTPNLSLGPLQMWVGCSYCKLEGALCCVGLPAS